MLFLFTLYPEGIISEEIGEELLERVQYYSNHPVDINSASFEELLDVPFMTREIALGILRMRKREPFETVDQILLIDEITPILFLRLKPLLRVRKKKGPPPPGYTYLFKGIYPIPDTLYDASPVKLYGRVNLRGRIKSGIVFEKDYYEKNYLDYLGGYLGYKGFIVGNFDISEGLGLVFGRPGFFYKPAGFPETRKDILPHLSTYESGYFTGIAFMSGIFSPFITYSFLDATIGDSTFNHYTGGYHRTNSELNKKDAITEFCAGSIVKLKGFTIAFAQPFYSPVPPVNKTYPMVSLSYSKKIAGFTTITELGYSNGYTGGILIKTPMGFQALYRYFSDGFKGLRTYPLPPEEGIYLHYEGKFLEFKTSVYLDCIKSDSGEYTFESGITGIWPIMKGVQAILRWKGSKTRTGLRGEIIVKKKEVYLKIRLQVASAMDERGYGGYITIGRRGNLSFEFRYTVFNTPSFNSALYFYENDLPGEYSIIPLYGDGYRYYILLREKGTGLYARIGTTRDGNFQTRIGMAITK